MSRKIQLDNKKIELIKKDIERLGLHPTSAIEFEAMQLTELTTAENEAVKSKNSQWLLSKKYPDRYGDHKNQTTIDDQANSLIQALININLPNPEPKTPIDETE